MKSLKVAIKNSFKNMQNMKNVDQMFHILKLILIITVMSKA